MKILTIQEVENIENMIYSYVEPKDVVNLCYTISILINVLENVQTALHENNETLETLEQINSVLEAVNGK